MSQSLDKEDLKETQSGADKKLYGKKKVMSATDTECDFKKSLYMPEINLWVDYNQDIVINLSRERMGQHEGFKSIIKLGLSQANADHVHQHCWERGFLEP